MICLKYLYNAPMTAQNFYGSQRVGIMADKLGIMFELWKSFDSKELEFLSKVLFDRFNKTVTWP